MAIAQDTTTKTGNLTWTHTCTGSNLILIVYADYHVDLTVTGITYNGVALTLLTSLTGLHTKTSVYYLLNPSTGANTVTVSATGTNSGRSFISASYTGARQINFPDSSNSFNNTNLVNVLSTTVVDDNCWIIGIGSSYTVASSDETMTLTSGLVMQKSLVYPVNSFGIATYWDSIGIVSSGIYSQTFTATGTGFYEAHGILISLAPYNIADLPVYTPSIITAVKKVLQNLPVPQFIMAGYNASTYKLFKKSTSYVFNLWRSPVYQIGQNFDILAIRIPIHPDMTTNMSIIPVLYFDNEDSNSVGTTLNSTNYPNSDRLIYLTPKNFSNTVHGRNNFFLELQFIGSALSVVELPITIDLEVQEL